MTEQPLDLTIPQPPVSVQAPPPPQPRRLGIRQLLGRLAETAAEQAATEEAEPRQRLERVAQLARELDEALSQVEVARGPGGSRPA
jgi:hypothetical protein